MDPVHANYPFLDAAREAVREADVGLPDIIAADRGGGRHPAVERGVQRVERALLDGTVDLPAGERHPGVQAELLSYPVARVLVSLLETPGVVDKYATAEARTAYQRFTDDFATLPDDRRRPDDGKVPLAYLLSEFDLADAVERDPPQYRLDVAPYLRLSAELDGERWQLVTRALADGRVVVSEDELHELLREAVRQRVAEGLPTRVPDAIREGLTDELAELEASFSEIEISRDIDTLDPAAFPPCVTDLVDRARDGEDLPAPAEFALVAFLTSANADSDRICDLLDVEGDTAATAVAYRANRVGDDAGAQYPPPSCATVQAYGQCPVADETDPTTDARCETISHPLAYYEQALQTD
ncbi:DNA primase [Halobacteriales archaeon QS_1_67_19]|nr:MAG: DNA primase [Halobacteriales archaeon QS_1_67_19]